MKLQQLLESSGRTPPKGWEPLNKQHKEINKKLDDISKKIQNKMREVNALVPLIKDRREDLKKLEKEKDEINSLNLPDELMIKHKQRLEPLYLKLVDEHDRMQEAYSNGKIQLKQLQLDQWDLMQDRRRIIDAKKKLGPDDQGFRWT